MINQAFPDALPSQYRMHWYTIERVLGQGGFGITYLARDTNLDQQVAIKEFLPVEVASRRDDSTVRPRNETQRDRYRWGLDRFIQEARTLARFDHPNIVRVHSVFEHNGTAYMVMRFEEGENFGSLLDHRGTLAEADLLRVLMPVLDGLELVHNAGFIHRDIKPDNIHIRSDGSPVLLDFGSARHALGKAHTLTILVAPGYAPFEQYHSSSENQGPWTDIYGLGATCYRAVAGAPPLDAITRSKGILGSTREVLVPAAVVGSGRYPGQLLAAIDHALAFAEKDRPQTITEWRRELKGESAFSNAASTAPPVKSVAGGIGTQMASAAPMAAGGARTQFTWAIIGGMVGAIVIIAVVIFFWRGDPTTKGPDVPSPTAPIVAPVREDEEQERKRVQAEMERKRLDEEAAQKRLQAEAEWKRLQAETETQRKQAEAEIRRLQQEAEKRRRDYEAEKKQLARVQPPRSPDRTVSPPTPEPEPGAAPESAPPRESAPKAPPPEWLARVTEAEARGDASAVVKILTPPASAGNAAAQMRLGDLYYAGRGVPSDAFRAYIWYSLSVRCGNAGAATAQAGAARRLQQPQVDQADGVVAGMKICK